MSQDSPVTDGANNVDAAPQRAEGETPALEPTTEQALAPDARAHAEPVPQTESVEAAANDSVPPAAISESATQVPIWMRGHPILWYSLARLVVLILVGAILYGFGARGVLLLVLALLISGLVSFLVLDRLRNVVSLRVVERAERARSAREQRLAEEDDVL